MNSQIYVMFSVFVTTTASSILMESMIPMFIGNVILLMFVISYINLSEKNYENTQNALKIIKKYEDAIDEISTLLKRKEE